MQRFVDKAKEIGFMDMEENYDNPNITDIAATITSVVVDDHYTDHGIPHALLPRLPVLPDRKQDADHASQQTNMQSG